MIKIFLGAAIALGIQFGTISAYAGCTGTDGDVTPPGPKCAATDKNCAPKDGADKGSAGTDVKKDPSKKEKDKN